MLHAQEFWSYYLLLWVYSRLRQKLQVCSLDYYFAGCLVWPQCAVCGGWSQSGTVFASRLKPGVSFSVRHISCPSNNRWGDILILMKRMLLHEESEKSNYCVSLSRQPCLSPHWADHPDPWSVVPLVPSHCDLNSCDSWDRDQEYWVVRSNLGSDMSCPAACTATINCQATDQGFQDHFTSINDFTMSYDYAWLGTRYLITVTTFFKHSTELDTMEQCSVSIDWLVPQCPHSDPH